MLGARLVGANSDGSVVLRTAHGDLTLNVPINVPPGASLQVQLQPGNPPTAVLILMGGETQAGGTKAPNLQLPALNIPNLTAPPSSTTTASGNTAQAPAALLPQQLAELKLNVVVRALVMEALQMLAQQPSSSALNTLVNKPEVLANMLEQLATKAGLSQNAQAELLSQLGTPGKLPNQIGQLTIPARLLETVQQTIQLLQQQPGGTKGLSNDQSALLQLLQSSQSGNAAAAAAARAPTMTTQLLPGMELNLKLVQIIPPVPGTSTPVPVTILPNVGGALTISGQVTPQTVNGQPVIQTEQGNILLQASNKLSVGTTVVFELVQQGASTSAAPGALAEVLKTNSAMPKLELAMQALHQLDDEMFRAMINTMPKLNGQLPVTALFFMQALRTGDIRNWLGDKSIQMLRRSGGEAVRMTEEMAKEFGAVSDKAKHVMPGEWRQVTIPYLAEQGMSSMRLAVRDHYQSPEDEKSSGKGGGGEDGRVTRFLFDIEFSELGPMQIDGLMRPGTDHNKQLDIVLRTRELLPSDMRRELRELFSESLGTYGMHGGLSYQAGFQNWIRLAEERNSNARI